MITITNTLSGKKELFASADDKRVTLYVCGVTPYDWSHIGHGRVYVSFDVFYRLLTFLGYTVSYCRNFTDIDDKILKKAEAHYGDRQRYTDITAEFIEAYHDDMKSLGCLSPDNEPRVTDNIPQIIAFVQGLIDAGKAYAVDGDVYFSLESFPAYGKLSRHKLEDLRAGSRVEVNEKKRDPLDFALWKAEPDGQFWQSPWGWGRPGWHIECSALAAEYLGKSIDIHAGGLDLVFPHHENEIAQSEGLHGVPFAKYWMHNGLVRINQEKMSKSLGNFFTLREVFKQFDPMVIRYYYLTHQYRAPLEFSFDDIKAVEKSYQRLCRVFDAITCDDMTDEQIKASPTVQKMLTFLQDDLNTPGMLGVLFENLTTLGDDACAVKLFVQRVLGLALQPLPEKEIEITPEIQALIDERVQARADKNWARADEIRDQLTALGVDVQDKKL